MAVFRTDPVVSALGEDWVVPEARKRKSFARLRSFYAKTNLFWVALALGSLAAQATKSASSSDAHLAIVSECAWMSKSVQIDARGRC